MHSFLRLATTASVIAFTGAIALGSVAVLPRAFERLPSTSGESRPAECRARWLSLDPNCLTRRELPWIAPAQDVAALANELEAAAQEPEASGYAAAVEITPEKETPQADQWKQIPQVNETRAVEPKPEETRPETAALEEPQAQARPIEPEVLPPAAPVPQQPRNSKPRPPAQAHLPVVKKPALPQRTAKRPASEAANPVRRFGDDLRDIPVNSYSGDGSRRTIIIHPTSRQDMYYYSVPR